MGPSCQRGQCFFREIRWPVRWVPAVRGQTFFSQNTVARPVGPCCQLEESSFFRVIRRVLLAAAVGPAETLHV